MDRPLVRQADRSFSWGDPTAHILRRIQAADGRPGVHTELAGARSRCSTPSRGHRARRARHHRGTHAKRRRRSGPDRTGALWIGHARRLAPEDPGTTVKLPAVLALGDRVPDVPRIAGPPGLRDIAYRRVGRVGLVRFECYNGAMTTAQCRRLTAAVRFASAQDTDVLVLAAGAVFSNGLHLGVIDAHPDPAAEAWRNITAIDDLCREIISCTGQLVVSARVVRCRAQHRVR